MQNHWLFVLMAAATIASPGPAVLLTLSNALRNGVPNTLAGIFGVACGGTAVAALSATGVGMILLGSAWAFTLIKYLGAAYLIYLGIQLLRAAPAQTKTGTTGNQTPSQGKPRSKIRYFMQGLLLQLTNPKALFFFVAIFPQFLDPGHSHLSQFALLVLTYGALVLCIHCTYCLIAKKSSRLMTSATAGHAARKISGAVFVLFGIMLTRASR